SSAILERLVPLPRPEVPRVQGLHPRRGSDRCSGAGRGVPSPPKRASPVRVAPRRVRPDVSRLALECLGGPKPPPMRRRSRPDREGACASGSAERCHVLYEYRTAILLTASRS